MVKKSALRTRRTHTPVFKAQVALAALRKDKTLENVFLKRTLTKAGLLSAKR